ncbi:hypothetical protein V6U89_29865 [Micromonospora sp. CPCC 206171]|uniref:hypothetical protein n=1 Tax=Micromonospora sp. CPCC 206171 TaxID=3122405 RepID=UPI002FF1DB5A
MAWYLNTALTNFRRAVNEKYPNRDKASDGTIGDADHLSRSSDHNEDPDGSVDAWDMDVDLRSGNDPAAIEELKRVFQAHESSRYWIHNGKIASRTDGWKRRDYTGKNPHDKHVHWNTRESHEDSAKPWFPKSVPLPTQEVNVQNLVLAREEKTAEVFVGNGITRRHVKNEAELEGLQYWIKKRGGDPTVYLFKPGTIGVLGVVAKDAK